MIKVDKLCKRFDDFIAVNELSFTVNPGEVVGFLGPNGAGKSTTMKMLTGFLEPSAGSIHIFNQDIETNSHNIKQLIGYLPEGAPAYGDMTVSQYLNFIADVRGLTGNDRQQKLHQVIADVELNSVLTKIIDNLSKGFKRRVGLAQAILHDPKILILDEPTDGLDPNQKHQVRRLIQNLAKDKIVIISTHILEEVTAVCNRAIIIANGEKVFDDTPLSLEEKSHFHHAVTVIFAELIPENAAELKELASVDRLQINHEQQQLTVFPEKDFNNKQQFFSEINQFAHNKAWPISALYAEKGRLDDVFRELTH